MSRDGSRIPGFYRLSVTERRALLRSRSGSDGSVTDPLGALDGGLSLDEADGMIENVVGTYALPLGVALNFRINERDYLVPMVVEEPSVVAAASNAARMVRAGGGFRAAVSTPVMIGQIQLVDVPDPAPQPGEVVDPRVDLLEGVVRGFGAKEVLRGVTARADHGVGTNGGVILPVHPAFARNRR